VVVLQAAGEGVQVGLAAGLDGGDPVVLVGRRAGRQGS